jgi:hypothetical protein
MNDTTTRRRFFGGAAALAAPLAGTTAVASDDLAARLAALEDENTIRALLRDWARGIGDGKVAAPAANIRGLTLDADVSITVAENGTASASVPCTIATATPIGGDETLVEMARLQGDGVVKGTERRVLYGRLVKQEGAWQLASADLSRAEGSAIPPPAARS